MILTVVGIAYEHWPEHWSSCTELLKGYRIIDEDVYSFANYKLPLIYVALFLSLLFGGAGRASEDYYFKRSS